MAYANRGLTWSLKAEHDRAIADYQKAIDLAPGYADAYNNLAWLLATCPREKYRDGRAAVEHALKACQLTEWTEVCFIDTLAAAYAEAGELGEAVKWQTQAMAMCPKDQQGDCQVRLDLYKAGNPYRANARGE
jgi:serine/threonine-protein kinase